MIGKSQSRVKPQALGATLQSSTYGQTIPVIYGCTKGALYLIWMENVRQGDSGKKGKKSKKGAPATYVANVDCLIGTNPIVTVLDCWNNNQAKLPLNIVRYVTGGGGTVTIPDSEFYAIIGITAPNWTYNQTFNDYGAPGPTVFTGTGEYPLMNLAYRGPDGAPLLPYFYRWIPGTPSIFFEHVGPPGGSIAVYYAQVQTEANTPGLGKHDWLGQSPLAQLRLTFEPILGNGPEYGSDYALEQIQYPHYAGVGSPEMDLGAGGVAPVVRPEVLGTFPVYATGDTDFAYIVMDIFGRAITQAGWVSPGTLIASSDITGYQTTTTSSVSGTFPGTITWSSSSTTTPITSGSTEAVVSTLPTPAYSRLVPHLGATDFPGVIYSKYYQYGMFGGQGNPFTITYDQANTAGNFLIVVASMQGGGPMSVSDSAGNTWHALFTSSDGTYQAWYAQCAVNAQNNTVSVSGSTGTYFECGIHEIAGVDTVDATATGTSSVTLTTSNPNGSPAYLWAVTIFEGGIGSVTNQLRWNTLTGSFGQQFHDYGKLTYFQNTFTLSDKHSPTAMGMIAFKCATPPNYIRFIGQILDQSSLALCQQFCRANGIWGSLVMDSQKKASEWLTELYDLMLAAPVWSGFTMKSIPYSEVSYVGNGGIYTAPTSSGPVENLTISDFIYEDGQPFCTVERTAQADVPNILQIQHPNRESDYNQVVTSQAVIGPLSQYGHRKEDPKTYNEIQDVAVANKVLTVLARRQNTVRNTIKGKIHAKWKLLEPMDLITIPDPATGLHGIADPVTGWWGSPSLAVRITKMTEDERNGLDCEFEPFIYGLNAPLIAPGEIPTVTPPSPFSPPAAGVPAPVNAPVFLQPIYGLSKTTQQQLWVVVSDMDPNYGGCQVYISTDGGASYKSYGTITGNAITGYLTKDWPAAADPDTTNALSVDLSESNGTLPSYGTADRDNFVYPYYVEGTLTSPVDWLAAGLTVPYELMCFGASTLTGPSLYTVGGGSTGQNPPATLSWNIDGATTVKIDSGSGPVVVTGDFLNVTPGATTTYTLTATNTAGTVTAQFIVTVATPAAGAPTITDFHVTKPLIASGDTAILSWTTSGATTVSIDNGVGTNLAASGTAEVDPTTTTTYTLTATNGSGTVTAKCILTVAAAISGAPTIYAFDGTPLITAGTIPGTGELRRAVWSAPQVLQGIDHPIAKRFAFVGTGAEGILKLSLDPLWIGQTLYFKFVQFNQAANAYGSLSDAVAYPYTPYGAQANKQITGDYTAQPGDTSVTSTATTASTVTLPDPNSAPNTTTSYTNSGTGVETIKDSSGNTVAVLQPGESVTLQSTQTGWVQVAGTVPRFIDDEIPSGVMDGTNATFTTAHLPISSSLKVYFNGERLLPTVQFTVSGSTITLIDCSADLAAGLTAVFPDASKGDSLHVEYRW